MTHIAPRELVDRPSCSELRPLTTVANFRAGHLYRTEAPFRKIFHVACGVCCADVRQNRRSIQGDVKKLAIHGTS